MGQKVLYLKPSLGMQFPFSYVQDKSTKEITFRGNTFDFGLDGGLTFQFDLDKKNSLIFGWNSAGLGYSFRFGAPKYGFERRSSTTSTLQIFPLGYQRHVTTVKWFKLKRRVEIFENLKGVKPPTDDILYLVLFRLRFLGGLSYYYLQPMTDDNTKSIRCLGDCIIESQVLQRSNVAIFGGVNLQFFIYDKNSFQLSFIYSYGLLDQVIAKIDYRVESPSFDHRVILSSRGTYFTMQITYPLKLKSFKK